MASFGFAAAVGRHGVAHEAIECFHQLWFEFVHLAFTHDPRGFGCEQVDLAGQALGKLLAGLGRVGIPAEIAQRRDPVFESGSFGHDG